MRCLCELQSLYCVSPFSGCVKLLYLAGITPYAGPVTTRESAGPGYTRGKSRANTLSANVQRSDHHPPPAARLAWLPQVAGKINRRVVRISFSYFISLPLSLWLLQATVLYGVCDCKTSLYRCTSSPSTCKKRETASANCGCASQCAE